MFKMYIDTANAAFDDGAELETARILREIADKLDAGELENSVRDFNGNKVGTFELTDA